MIYPENNTSIFQALWDYKFALFVTRIAFYYFLLGFISGCIISYFWIAQFQPLSLLTQPQSEHTAICTWLVYVALWARFIVVNYEVPQVKWLRLAIGLLAMVFLLSAELFLHELGYISWVWETDLLVAGVGVVALLLFAFMPSLLMGLEKKTLEKGVSVREQEKSGITNSPPRLSRTASKSVKQNGKSK